MRISVNTRTKLYLGLVGTQALAIIGVLVIFYLHLHDIDGSPTDILLHLRWQIILFSLGMTILSIWSAVGLERDLKNSVKRMAGTSKRVILEEFSDTLDDLAGGLKERDQAKLTIGKLHGKNLVDLLMRKELKLGGEQRNCLVLFSDIRGFTTLSENMSPELIVRLLNRYFAIMIKIIELRGGSVTNLAGDGIMAVWGLQTFNSDCANQAINACLEMREAQSRLNGELIAEHLSPFYIGMGLHYGPAIIGTIGSLDRMQYTAVGDTVNTASRIESITKEIGVDLLVSEAVFSLEPKRFIFEKMSAQLRGKINNICLFKVHGHKDDAGMSTIVRTPYSQFDKNQFNDAVRVLKLTDTSD